jgi:hypothetical protein
MTIKTMNNEQLHKLYLQATENALSGNITIEECQQLHRRINAQTILNDYINNI